MPSIDNLYSDLLSDADKIKIAHALDDALNELPIDESTWQGESRRMYDIIKMLLEKDIHVAQNKLKGH